MTGSIDPALLVAALMVASTPILLAGLAAACSPDAGGPRPSVLLVTLDGVRVDAVARTASGLWLVEERIGFLSYPTVEDALQALMEGRADPSISMPHGQRDPVPDKDIAAIRTWIEQGARNN